MKWQFVTKWLDPERVVVPRDRDISSQSLGWWSRTKRYLARKWLQEIDALPRDMPELRDGDGGDEEVGLGMGMPERSAVGAVAELLGVATPVAMAGTDPAAAKRLGERLPLEKFEGLRKKTGTGFVAGVESRMGMPEIAEVSGEDGGVMVEEKSEDEVGGDDEVVAG